MEDAAGRKIPVLGLHTLDSCFVLAREGHICKIIAIIECLTPDVRHIVRNRNARKTTATLERLTPDACHIVWYCHARKVRAPEECSRLNSRHTIWYRYARKLAAVKERSIPDACHCCSNDYFLWLFYPCWGSTSLLH